MLPAYFEFYNPVKIVSGHKALDNLPHELEQLGVNRPLIVTDPGVRAAGLLELVTAAFAESNAAIGGVYDRVPPDSSHAVVNNVARAYREALCDSLVAVGGGSVIDTAKGANIVITEGADDLMRFVGAEVLRKPMRPLVVVPTTAGTGSEVTLVAVIANPEKNVKMAFSSYHLLPKVAILDPRMTLSLPPRMTAATAMDALAHAMEATLSLQRNPLSDAHAHAAIRLISRNLIPVVKDGKDVAGRFALANASCLAGAAFSNAMVGAVHSLGHALGSVCHVPHGVAMNILLPHGLEYNLKSRREPIGDLLLPLAGPETYAETPAAQRPQKTVAFVRELQDELHRLAGLPRTLSEADVPPERFEDVARTAVNDPSVIFNPEELEYQDALALLHKAWTR